MEAKIGLVRSVYSQRSASKSFKAFLRPSTSVCADAANATELPRNVSTTTPPATQARMIQISFTISKSSRHYKLVTPALHAPEIIFHPNREHNISHVLLVS
jgi:hypothetical protein